MMMLMPNNLQGASSPSQCERIALLLHYTYLSCAMWIVALAAAVAEYCACDTLLPLKYIYLLAYGVPAIVVMVILKFIFTFENKVYNWRPTWDCFYVESKMKNCYSLFMKNLFERSQKGLCV